GRSPGRCGLCGALRWAVCEVQFKLFGSSGFRCNSRICRERPPWRSGRRERAVLLVPERHRGRSLQWYVPTIARVLHLLPEEPVVLYSLRASVGRAPDFDYNSIQEMITPFSLHGSSGRAIL